MPRINDANIDLLHPLATSVHNDLQCADGHVGEITTSLTPQHYISMAADFSSVDYTKHFLTELDHVLFIRDCGEVILNL